MGLFDVSSTEYVRMGFVECAHGRMASKDQVQQPASLGWLKPNVHRPYSISLKKRVQLPPSLDYHSCSIFLLDLKN